MATAAVTTTLIGNEAVLYEWTLTQADADGASITAHEYGDRTAQIGTSGTTGFGTGTAVMQGSNDGTNWFALTDPQGDGISKTTASLKSVMETPLRTRPVLTGATGGESVSFKLLCRRTRR